MVQGFSNWGQKKKSMEKIMDVKVNLLPYNINSFLMQAFF